MNAFEYTEHTGRREAIKALQSSIARNGRYSIVPTTEDGCKWDLVLVDTRTARPYAIVEVKHRRMDSTDGRVRRGGVQLETAKFDALRKQALKQKVNAYYLATFDDGTAMMWDLFTAPTHTDVRWANKTTAVDSYKIQKTFNYFFPIDSIIGTINI